MSKKIQVQRIKHLPTGLYFCPSREIKVTVKDKECVSKSFYCKSNLSKIGKFYKNATLKYVSGGMYNHLDTKERIQEYIKGTTWRQTWGTMNFIKNKGSEFVESEWMIENVEVS
jgi:hypothetical protein